MSGIRKKIEELEKRHRVIAENLIDAIWSINADTLKFEYITPSIKKISGFSADEYLNMTIQDRLTPDSFQKALAVLLTEMPKFEEGVKSTETLELEFIHKKGHTYWAEVRARFTKEAGAPLKIVGVISEISERKRAEKYQNDLIRKLGEALAEKDRLLVEVKMLKNLLPICSGCKRIRDENGKWWPLDAYVNARTEAELTHTICTDCKDVFYGD